MLHFILQRLWAVHELFHRQPYLSLVAILPLDVDLYELVEVHKQVDVLRDVEESSEYKYNIRESVEVVVFHFLMTPWEKINRWFEASPLPKYHPSDVNEIAKDYQH